MKRRAFLAWCALGAGVAAARAQPGPARAPAAGPAGDFKLKVALYESGETPVETADLLARAGRIYQFRSDSKEAVIVDPAERRIDLIDFAAQRRARASISLRDLDQAVQRLKQALDGSAEKREKKGGKANLLAARMTRALIAPRLEASFQSDARRLSLQGENATVQVTGEPEPDRARLQLVAESLGALTKLEWIRLPEDVPPFTRLESLWVLVETHALRPTELAVVYRLAGPPRKLRWTFELVPTLSINEREAIARIDAFKPQATNLGFARYERLGKH